MTAKGQPDVLNYEEVKEPKISSPSQIKVKLQSSGVNPIDTKIRKNMTTINNA